MKLGLRRYSTVELLISLGLLLFAAPFVDALPHGEVLVSCLLALMLVSAVLAIGSRRRDRVVASILAGLLVVSRTMGHLQPGRFPSTVTYLTALVFSLFIVTHLLRYAMRAKHVDSSVLCAALSAYLLLGLAWSPAYLLAANADPNAFSFNAASNGARTFTPFDAFYFSLVTLTTVGYGDITPVSRVARMLAVLEAMVGLLYIAVLIARLVALYSPPRSPSPGE